MTIEITKSDQSSSYIYWQNHAWMHTNIGIIINNAQVLEFSHQISDSTVDISSTIWACGSTSIDHHMIDEDGHGLIYIYIYISPWPSSSIIWWSMDVLPHAHMVLDISTVLSEIWWLNSSTCALLIIMPILVCIHAWFCQYIYDDDWSDLVISIVTIDLNLCLISCNRQNALCSLDARGIETY